MKNNYVKMTLMSAALAAFLLPAAAQTSSTSPSGSTPPSATPPATTNAPATPNAGATPTSTAPKSPETAQRINQRKENQQDRIAGGVDHGSLTPGETQSLEKQESGINQEEKTMRQQDNGHLTTADRQAIQQQQNNMNNQIYKDKHNAAVQNTNPTAAPTNKVNGREQHEQQRIAGGIKSGELTPAETANLEKQQNHIDQEVKSDRAANGGHLTQQEKNQIQHQQNKAGHQIYKDKHNAKK
jgi:hypothetical protein